MARSGLLTNEVVFVRFLALPAINRGRGKDIKTSNKICGQWIVTYDKKRMKVNVQNVHLLSF